MLILVLVLLKVLLNSFPSGIILIDKAYTNVLNFEFYVTANNLEELECHAVQPILTSDMPIKLGGRACGDYAYCVLQK